MGKKKVDLGRAVRLARFLSCDRQEDIAAELGVDRSTLSRWESREAPVPARLRQKLAEILLRRITRRSS